MTLKGWITFAYWVVINQVKPTSLIADWDPISNRIKLRPKPHQE